MQGRTRFSSRTIASTICAAAAPGAYQAEVPSRLTSSPPPLAVRSTIAWIRSSGASFRSGIAADGRRGDDGDHLVAVAAEHHRGHVLDRHAGLPGDERREAGRVEDPCHAEDALLRPGRRRSSPRGTSRRAGSRRRPGSRPGSRAITCSVTELTIFSFVVTRSSRLMPGWRGSPAVITTTSEPADLVVAVRAGHVRLVAEDGGRLVDVQRLALRETFLDVDQHDVGVVAARELLRAGRTHVAGADNGDLRASRRNLPASR